MSVKSKCKQCGKSLLSHHQLRLRKYIGDGWDRNTIHYKCWVELKYQSDLATITEGVARLTLNDTHQCVPAASTTYFSWLLLLLPLLFLSQLLFLFVLL